MLRLLLVRHGETAWNRDGRYQGQTDVPLSEMGLAQAQALAERLAREKLDAIYSSDLQRARQTAAAIAAPLGLAVRPDRRLRELCFGQWEGLTYRQVVERYPEARAFWETHDLYVAPPGGESRMQMLARLQQLLADIRQESPDQSVVLVAHGGPLKLLVCLAIGLAPSHYWQLRLDNASLSEICLYEEGGILTLLNDRHHLAKLSAIGDQQAPSQ